MTGALTSTTTIGLSLPGIYGVWLLVLVLLYPICRWFAKRKESCRGGGGTICDRQQNAALLAGKKAIFRLGMEHAHESLSPPTNSTRNEESFMIRICAFGLLTAFVISCSAPSAIAGRFDGRWRMVAMTRSGHCGKIPVGVGISRGQIYSTGGSFVFTGFSWEATFRPRARSG